MRKTAKARHDEALQHRSLSFHPGYLLKEKLRLQPGPTTIPPQKAPNPGREPTGRALSSSKPKTSLSLRPTTTRFQSSTPNGTPLIFLFYLGTGRSVRRKQAQTTTHDEKSERPLPDETPRLKLGKRTLSEIQENSPQNNIKKLQREKSLLYSKQNMRDK
ncbi:hypothetical protein AVEN_10956-1 [Araneus ventricosus]|uniref:Uncharacterized protein n=1 Tax=Araneus ventricosus TaxID=182803 RepID=A0A4Y2UF30_ARAVE|nr:hypothetical protein AVEN_10956-1 [Araneus ventricosus]